MRKQTLKKGPEKSTPLLLVALFSGVVALIFEVVWTREISIILGSSTYALSTILTAFMAGLALGAYVGGRIADKMDDLKIALFFVLIGFAFLSLASVPLIQTSSRFYFWLHQLFSASWQSMLAASFIVSFCFLLVPCALLGAVFPFVARIYTGRFEQIGREVGDLYSLNTLGSVLGAFGAGFVLITFFGLKGCALIAASLDMVVAVYLLLSFRRQSNRVVWLSLGAFAVYAVVAVMYLLFKPFPYLFHFPQGQRYRSWDEFKQERSWSKLVYYREDVEGTVSIFDYPDGLRSLEINGRTEGSNGLDMANQVLLAALPKAYYPEADSFLNIGLGTGTTLYTASKDKTYGSIDSVEINKSVTEAVKKKFYPSIYTDRRIKAFHADARNFLLVNEKKYDVISSEPSYPTESSVSHLFTVEFLRLAKSRMSSKGVYCQWLPFYLYTRFEVDIFAKTFGTVFPSVNIWQVRPSGDLLFIGSKSPLSEDQKEIQKHLDAIFRRYDYASKDVVELRRNSEQVRATVNRKDLPLNTDDKPILEFAAIKHALMGEGNREKWDTEFQNKNKQ